MFDDNLIDDMRHCIGMNYRKPYTRYGKKYYKPFRNHMAFSKHDEQWDDLVKNGYAECVEKFGSINYWLTRKGLDALGEQLGMHIYDLER